MNILVVMKRFGANKDMVTKNFGRQIRLFKPLAKKHKIDFLCPDYVKKESKIIKKNNIRFIIVPSSVFSVFGFLKSLNNLIEQEKYDLIVATTDPLIGAVCYRFSKKYKIPLIYDLQDNFEVYDTYKIPYVRHLHNKVVENADAVICVSENLKKKIVSLRKKPTYVIENGFEIGLFRAIDRHTARKRLRLPLNAKIIVYIGHIEKLKGFKIMVDAFNKVRQKYSNTYLLLSGKIEMGISIKHKNIIFRAFPKRQEVVLGINAADVAIISNPVNEFTKYAFPYKLVEYMACKVPIVATNVGDISRMLKKYPGSLCKPNDADDLAKKMINKLNNYKRVNYGQELRKLEWNVLAKKLNNIITGFSD